MVSLENALQRYHLTPKQLTIPISFKHCIKFAEKLTEWEPLASRLRLEHSEITRIQHDHPQNLKSKCSACLTKWQDKFGSQATFLKLAQALEEIESMNHIERLIEIFLKHNSAPPSDLSSEILPVESGNVNETITQFTKRFKTLVKDTMKELRKDAKICMEDLQYDLTLLPEDIKRNHATYITENIKKLNEVADVRELFLLLNTYWDSFNYTLLEVLVNEHGSAELQLKMNTYVSELQQFWRETAVADFLTSCGNKSWLHKVPKEFAEIKCAIDKPVTELTLYDVEQYRLQFSQNLQLREFVLILHKLDKSLPEITWLLDDGLVPQLKQELRSDLRKILEGIHVKQVVVDGESVHQSQSPSPSPPPSSPPLSLPHLRFELPEKLHTSESPYIDKILSKDVKLPLTVEMWRPYLFVKGLEDWIEKDYIAEHFEAEANGAKIEYVELDKEGTEARIMFIDPQVALRFPSSTDILGLTLELKVMYPSPAEEKEMVLSVEGLPLHKFPAEKLRDALVNYISKHTSHKAAECRIIDGVGYLSFDDPAAVNALLSNPPTANFFAGSSLKVSAAPISKMLLIDDTGMEEEPSTAYKQAYSSPSESSTSAIVCSPSTSRKALGREVSREAIASFKSRNSISSDYVPSPVNLVPGVIPKKDFTSGGSVLFTVPEGHASSEIMDDLQIEDIESLYDSSPVFLPASNSPTRILVEDVPHAKRDISLIKYYLDSLAQVECEVKQYGNSFLATFPHEIDFQKFKESGHVKPLNGQYHLSFCLLDSTRQVLVTFGDTEPIISVYTLKLHFESIIGKKSVENVTLSPPNKAYITFKESKSVHVAISNQECCEFDGISILISEYYDFMTCCGDETTDSLVEQTPPSIQPTPMFDWTTTFKFILMMQSVWLQCNFPDLNDTLAAHASIEDDLSVSSAQTPYSLLKSEQTSMEEEVWIKSHQWNVLSNSKGLGQELDKIKHRDVEIQWPGSHIEPYEDSCVTIKGDPALVNKVKSELEALQKKVCHREEKLSNIPAAVVNIMGDKIYALMSQYGASIDVSIASEDSGSGRTHSQCATTASKLSRSIHNSITSFITLEQGSLLDQKADVYVNSTNSNLDLKTGTLSNELLKACGDELQKKCSEYAPLKPEEVAVTEAKNLKANSIYHIALPDYTDGQATKKFRRTVKKILYTAKENGAKSLAIPSIGVGNLHYPAHTSAKILFGEVVEFQARNPGVDIQYHCVVYDQKTYQEFQKEFTKKMSNPPPQRKKLITSGAVTTRLSIENSDIAEEATEIIVNTTTEEMKLSDSAVSRALLKRAGPMLQQTCDQLIQSGLTLDSGNIVETKSYGSLKCKKIIHAHVPPRNEAIKLGIDHSALINEIVTKVLSKAESLGMKSISFPALGFGQGGYSIDEVAEPMLTAFRDFSQQGYKAIEVIKVVIFYQCPYQQFFNLYASFFKVDTSAPFKLASAIMSKLNPKGGYGVGHVVLQDHASPQQSHGYPEFMDLNDKLLQFEIYASSDAKCTCIAKQLREFVEEKAISEEINNPVIANFIDSDLDDIMTFETTFQVQIKVIPQLQMITIQGEISQCKDAKQKIMEVIMEVEKCKSELKNFQWLTEDIDNNTEPYSGEVSLKLERARDKIIPALQLVIDDDTEILVDFYKMEERSVLTGAVRKVIRFLKSNLSTPVNWESQPLDADGNPKHMHMFDIPQSSPEYAEALDDFQKTINQAVTIISLQRIQNPGLYLTHAALEETICDKYLKQKVKIDVRRLFHGTSEDSIKYIASQGFDRIFAADANAAYFEKGAYFAVNSNYHAQASCSKDGHQMMFICRVLIGRMKKAPSLMKDSNEVYDTSVDNIDKPTIFVAMNDGQAYPEYLVTFKIDRS